MKIVTILGARPQFVKAAPVSKVLRREHQELILHTGQHYDNNLSNIFFEELNIPRPDINLEVGSGSHAEQTSAIMIGIEKYLQKEKPDLVLIYGDTNSTLAGSIAASKLNIKTAHVEAGLRSYNSQMPEEINRIVADKISDLLLCPTKRAIENLKSEGISKNIFNTGDVMYDAALHFAPLAEKNSAILDKLSIISQEYILLTLHRAENTNSYENLNNIVTAIINTDMLIVAPLHPRTINYLKQYQLLHKLEQAENIKIIEPVSFLDMIQLEKNAYKILTDSGGVQKEAYFYKVPCITLRQETEWVETVDDGWNCLVGANSHNILANIKNFSPDSLQKKHYGDGNASENILKILNTSL